MANPIISVIVPALNAETFLGRCIASIRAQSFGDYEVWIVNPSSQDSTEEVAREYCRMDKRIHLTSCETAPCGISRNAGMDKARGEYISFIDADDTVKPDFLHTMYSRAIEEKADITVCDFNMVYPDRTIPGYTNLEDYSVKLTDDMITDYYYRFGSAPRPNNYGWSRLYRAGFLNGLRHELVPFGEDHMLNLRLLCKNPRIAHIGKAPYNYIQRDDSIMRTAIRNAAYGEGYLKVYTLTREFMETLVDKPYVEPILSIYAYTRIKSILFYAWQAALDDEGIKKACDSFLSDERVRFYLRLCSEKGYISRYCDTHGFSAQWANTVREMLSACLNGTPLPDMKEIFK